MGEDWKNIQLSLVAGAPQTFVQELSQPYYTRRAVVPLPENVMLTPQTHEATMEEAQVINGQLSPAPSATPIMGVVGGVPGGQVGGVVGGKTGVRAESIRHTASKPLGGNKFNLATDTLKKGEHILYVVGSGETIKGIYGRGYDFTVE